MEIQTGPLCLISGLLIHCYYCVGYICPSANIFLRITWPFISDLSFLSLSSFFWSWKIFDRQWSCVHLQLSFLFFFTNLPSSARHSYSFSLQFFVLHSSSLHCKSLACIVLLLYKKIWSFFYIKNSFSWNQSNHFVATKVTTGKLEESPPKFIKENYGNHLKENGLWNQTLSSGVDYD